MKRKWLMRHRNIFTKTRKYCIGAGMITMILAMACFGCGEQETVKNSGETINQTEHTQPAPTEAATKKPAPTEAPTEATTAPKEYSLEDAKQDVIWHFKMLDDYWNGTYFINNEECKTNEKGYTIAIRYKLGRGEINTGYGPDDNIYVATVFVEKDTKILEYLDDTTPFYKLTKGQKVQL